VFSEGLNLREVRSIKDAKGQKYEKVIIQQASVPAGPSNGQQQQQMACAEQQVIQQFGILILAILEGIDDNTVFILINILYPLNLKMPLD
jgi:hypothetical protein